MSRLGEQLVTAAATPGNEVLICALVESGADVNFVTDCGRTALRAAVDVVCHFNVKTLLELGADMEVGHGVGGTALHLGVRSGDLGVVKLLVEAGAAIDAETCESDTPLHWATWRSVEIVKYLLDQGANVEAENCEGMTPAYCAIVQRHHDVLEFLLRSGATPNARVTGCPLVFHAIRRDDIRAIDLLVAAGADIHVENEWEESALFVANEESTPETLAHLRAKYFPEV